MLKTWLSFWFLFFIGSIPALAQTAATPALKDAVEYRHAVTLLSSFDPIPESMLPRDIPEKIYRTQVNVFGRTIYFVRMGFYATAGEADLAKQRMQARFPAALVTEITPDEYLKATGGKPKAAPVVAAPQAPLSKPATPSAPPVPLVPAVAPPPTPVVAAPAVPSLPAPAVVEAKPAVAPTVATMPAPAVKTTTPIEEEAGRLMEQARDALSRGDNGAAIAALNGLLRLPPNAHSQDAQELVGLARERQNQIAAARQEYNLYLRLYPEGPGADRVRQRLAALDAPATPAVALKKSTLRETPSSIRGSFAQYYYYGKSQLDSNTTVLGPATSTSLASTDTSALYNHLDLRARATSGNWDNRFVLRDTYMASFLDEVDSYNRLYSAYYEATHRVNEYTVRFGRQPGTTGGVLSRFDGVQMGYNVLPKWRVNFVGGTPVEFYPTTYSKSFWGTSLDFGLFANHWNGSLYYIQQTVEGIADRQALGSELRYFDPKGSALLYLDYDTLFGELNIATFQATWLSSPSTTWNLLADRRLAPILMTSNALFNTQSLIDLTFPPVTPTAAQAGSINYWLTQLTEDQLRSAALSNTPKFESYMLGVAHNLNSTWQIGGDVRRFNLTAPPTSPTITTTLGTGATMMYTVQTIANGLFRKRDLSVMSVSLLSGETYTGETIAFTHRMLFQDRWTLDLALSYYQQQNQPVETVDTVSGDTHSIQTDTTRITPMIRLGYRWGKNMTFETEFGIEKSTDHLVDTNVTTATTGTTDTDSSRSYFMLGYRWDF